MKLFFNFQAFKALYVGIGLITLTVILGTSGFMLIEHFSFVDAFYLTIITISTVGYGEIHPLSMYGRIFASFLIITNIGVFTYGISTVTSYLFDGEFQKELHKGRITKWVSKMENHVIVCGYGRNGQQTCTELLNYKKNFIVIEKDPAMVELLRNRHIPIIEGDAMDDDLLKFAGINKAYALISTLPKDADNVFVVLTARALNQKLLIISRASQYSSEQKLKQAGANNVIMPDRIGGTHMAGLVVKPDILEFIDYITDRTGFETNLETVTFNENHPSLLNKTLLELDIRKSTGANIIGFKQVNGDFVINPAPDTVITSGAKLFVLGTKDQIEKLRKKYC